MTADISDTDDSASPHQAEIKTLRETVARLEYRAETAEYEARAFRQLAEHIREVFWMTNAAGDELVYISPAYEAIWGQTCDSLHAEPGRRLQWVHDNDRERVLIAFKRDARDGAYDETFRIDRPDGEIRWIRDRAWPIWDDDGQIYRLAGFANDITATMADRDHCAALEGRLIARERLDMLATLGAGMAHDLGQPLTAARTQLARLNNLHEKDRTICREAARKADTEICRASEIVRHMRDYARQGRPSIGHHVLGDVLDDIRALTAGALRRHDVVCRHEIPEALHAQTLSLDRIFVQQILRNLIQNAIDALTGPDGPADRRLILLSAELSAPDQLALRVCDNGSGIESQVDPFTAFDTSKHDGLGLGLYVSRSLARSHGGDLVTEPACPPMQTCFVLRLPCNERADPGLPPVAEINVAGASRA